MTEIDFTEWARYVDQRKADLGITEADDEMFRNSGLRRTPEKREMLARIAERCHKAGIDPLPGNY